MNPEKQSDKDEFFSEDQLAAVLSSLEEQESKLSEDKKLSQDELDKIAKAWSKVKREKLFKQ
ncbi:MAG: hypothetical protein CME62_13935 [Halobacteriovoraceae bacterium]|nr:hypothetical protein [Halobacteriovoraceae bacterium]|tara:strand:- start:567 stop:752 length:186 start_codon:yes stop_codon:yes gene_type:complete